MTLSTRSQQALSHLQKLRPGEGWSVQQQSQSPQKNEDEAAAVRLLRRNVPLTDNYFVDLYYDGTDVVGLLSRPSANSQSPTQGQVLVDAKGQIVREMKLKSVRVLAKDAGAPTTTSSRSGSGSGSSNGDDSAAMWTPEQHKQMLQMVGGAVACAVAVRVVLQTLTVLYVLAIPALYVYLVSTCPSEDSFDAKQQLKRVLRGAHLPENHPDKPRGMLSEALARLQATVATELATLPGYEVTRTSVAGAVLVSCVRVPTAAMDFYWVGAANRWFYVTSVQLSNDENAGGARGGGGGVRGSVRRKRD
jgi:hypothetical protein